MNNKSLPLPSPDFDSIKSSLKTFMSNYDGLKDYDFNGSTISILLDTLAYNSHMNAFWLNMVGNEAFISTAIKRHNVVKSASQLGYIAKSAKASKTTLYLEFAPDGEIQNNIILDSGTSFISSTNSSTYTFNTLDNYIVPYNAEKGKYIIDKVDVYEGRLLVHEFNVVKTASLGNTSEVDSISSDGIVLPNLNVDSDLVRVYVKDEALNGEYQLFEKYVSGIGLSKDDLIYFTTENELGLVTIKFGDNRLGYRPSIGSSIKVVYTVASGPEANGILKFNLGTSVGNATISSVIPLHQSAGGSYPEDIESIRYNSSLAYESQGKAVVASDYEYLVRSVYPNAEKVITWGGQDANPPQYGKVFVAIQPKKGLLLSQVDKDTIRKYVRARNIATVDVIIIEPDYIYLDLDISLVYNQDGTFNIGEINTKVQDSIKLYNVNKLQTFNKSLEYSRLLGDIDSSSSYIKSNITDITLVKRFIMDSHSNKDYSINFGNAIVNESIKSSTFTYSGFNKCYFKSIGNKLSIVRINDFNEEVIILSDAGTIDYDLGIISIKSLGTTPDKLYFDEYKNAYFIKISALPKSNNISSEANQIIDIDKINIKYMG